MYTYVYIYIHIHMYVSSGCISEGMSIRKNRCDPTCICLCICISLCVCNCMCCLYACVYFVYIFSTIQSVCMSRQMHTHLSTNLLHAHSYAAASCGPAFLLHRHRGIDVYYPKSSPSSVARVEGHAMCFTTL